MADSSHALHPVASTPASQRTRVDHDSDHHDDDGAAAAREKFNGTPGQRSFFQAWAARSEFWQWNCFTACMGTGGVSILIGGCPFKFRGQRELGTVFFIYNLILYLIMCAGMITRYVKHRKAFWEALRDHEDGIYLPCCNLAFATLFVGGVDYALPYCGFWITRTWFVLWCVYIAAGLFVGMLCETTVRGRRRDLSTITPADVLPVFPLMLAGTLGSGLVKYLPLHEQGYVIIVSYMCQSMGMFISMLKLSVWMMKNMCYPNPGTVSLPGYLMAVGPPGFTAFAYLNLGQAAVEAFPAGGLFGGAADAGTAFLYISTFFALVFWGMGWWLLFSPMFLWLRGIVHDRKLEWGMGEWSLTFPLTGYFMAAAEFDAVLGSKTFASIQVLGIFVVGLAWLGNTIMMFYSVWAGTLLVKSPPKEKTARMEVGDEEAQIDVIPPTAGMQKKQGQA